MTEHAALAQWIVELLTVAEESQPTSAVRDETVRRLKLQTLGAAVLQALAAEPDNPGRRVRATVEVTGMLSADPQFAAWADEHRRWSAGGADPPKTAARPAGRNRGLGIRLGILGVVVLVGLIAIVVLVTSNSSERLSAGGKDFGTSTSAPTPSWNGELTGAGAGPPLVA
jgi:hypothetical protein